MVSLVTETASLYAHEMCFGAWNVGNHLTRGLCENCGFRQEILKVVDQRLAFQKKRCDTVRCEALEYSLFQNSRSGSLRRIKPNL